MATKKVEDVTKEPQAKTVEDVNNQDSRTRLWQSLSTTYGHQMDESDKAYDKAISQQDNAQLARGMGRSSYAGQIRANMYNDKVEARNKLGENLIADYQNRIGDIEKQENEEAWRQKEFEEGQRQFNESQAFQREQNELNRAFQTSEREAQQAWQAGENALGRAFTTSEREAQQKYNTSERLAQQGYNTSERVAQQNYQSAENAKNRELQQTLQSMSQAFNAEQNALNRQMETEQFNANLAFQQSEAARNQSNWEISQAFAEKQWQAQQEQWREEFDYEKMSTDQKLYYNYVIKAIEMRANVSDEMLAKAGLSKADYNAMIRAFGQDASQGYTGNYVGTPQNKPNGNTNTNNSGKPSDQNVLDGLGANGDSNNNNGNKTRLLVSGAGIKIGKAATDTGNDKDEIKK